MKNTKGLTEIHAFVFDLDGVLVDTAKYHFKGWSKLANTLGLRLGESDNHALKGVGRMESLEYILGKGGLELDPTEKARLAALKNAWYLEFVEAMSPDEILPGVKQFLQEAHDLGLKLAVGSGSKNARKVLDLIGISACFTAICDGNDIVHSKPHPEIFSTCCDRLGVLPEKAVVFEDAQSGIEAARAAGCRAVGIGDPETLEDTDLCISGFQGVRVGTILQSLIQTDRQAE